MSDPAPDGARTTSRDHSRLSSQRRRSERRRLWDRRAHEDRREGSDRRGGDRRRDVVAVAAERRSGTDRREQDRRADQERRISGGRRMGRSRRGTPSPYTTPEILQLRALFATPGLVICPACGGYFTLGKGELHGTRVSRRVMCLGCGRAAIVPDSLAARVILVDHAAESRAALRSALARAGHEVVETSEASVALEAYAASPADVVVINLPATGRMSAPEFMRRLLAAAPDARVVAAATLAPAGEADPLAAARRLGAVRTLRMPAEPDAVLKLVDEARR